MAAGGTWLGEGGSCAGYVPETLTLECLKKDFPLDWTAWLGLRLVMGFEYASQSICYFRMLGQKIDPVAFCGEIEQPLLTR